MASYDALTWRATSDRPYSLDASTCAIAAGRGHVHVLNWLILSAHLSQPGMYSANAMYSGLPMGRYGDIPLTVNLCAGAAQGGHLSVLMWLQEHGCLTGCDPFGPSTYGHVRAACLAAAAGGHLKLIEWAHATHLLDVIPGINNDVAALTLMTAEQLGHLHIVQFLETQMTDEVDQFESEQVEGV